jgi:hypothetical protein
MTRRKQAPKDLTGIRQRGSTYQVRISGGYDQDECDVWLLV